MRAAASPAKKPRVLFFCFSQTSSGKGGSAFRLFFSEEREEPGGFSDDCISPTITCLTSSGEGQETGVALSSFWGERVFAPPRGMEGLSLSVSAEEGEGVGAGVDEDMDEEAGGTSSAESPDSGKTISREMKGESSDSDVGTGVSSLGSDDASAEARA